MLWVAQPPLAAVSQWSARGLESELGRFLAAKFCLRVGWVAEGRQKAGEARVRITIEMRLPLQTDSTILTEHLPSIDPGLEGRAGGGEGGDGRRQI